MHGNMARVPCHEPLHAALCITVGADCCVCLRRTLCLWVMLGAPGYATYSARAVLFVNSGAAPNTSAAQDVTAVLQQQLQRARQATLRRTVEDIMYLWACHRLASGGVKLPGSVAAQQNSQVRHSLQTSMLSTPTTLLPTVLVSRVEQWGCHG